MTEPTQDAEHTFQVEEEAKGGSGCLRGCLIALLIVVVLGVIAGVLIARNWRSLMAGGIAAVTEAGIDASGLPPAEKAEVKAEFRRLTDGFQDGSISNEQLQRVMDGIVASPLFAALPVFVLDSGYIEASGLSEDQKAAGRMAVQRFLQGVADGTIPPEKVEAVLAPVADRDADGGWKLREEVTDEQLSAALAAATAAADEAGVPAEVPGLDVSEEIRKLIDAGLAGE